MRTRSRARYGVRWSNRFYCAAPITVSSDKSFLTERVERKDNEEDTHTYDQLGYWHWNNVGRGEHNRGTQKRSHQGHSTADFSTATRSHPCQIRQGFTGNSSCLAQPRVFLSLSSRHRSIAPSTISIDPITATTSASNRPLHMVSSACRFPRSALRMCTRYGLAVPSETT
jgi:hypothetical protein